VNGTSKYGLSRVVRVVLDLMTVKFLSMFSTRPIHVFGTFGIGLVAAGTVVLAWLGGQRLLFGTPLASRPLVLLAILFVVTGMQFVTLGCSGCWRGPATRVRATDLRWPRTWLPGRMLGLPIWALFCAMNRPRQAHPSLLLG
jgi:hypothetical protein